MTEKVLTGVGAALKQKREAAGLGVADVAQRLKLLPRQIESLEHERFDRLPGPTIARGMVQNYARLLELDPEPLLERMAPPAQKPLERGQSFVQHREQLPSATGSRRSTPLYVGVSVALLALVGAFAYDWQREDTAAPELVAPAQVAAVTEAPPLAEAPPPVQPPLQRESVVEALVAPLPEKPAESEKPHLVLRMQEEAWLEVRDGAGRSLVSSLQAAGSERVVRGQPPFQLVIGNAAHVRLTYDGKPVDLKPHIRGKVARFTLN